MAPPSFFAHIRRAHRHNVATLRRAPLAELSGALGDLGTLLPLLIALAVNGSVALAPTLVLSGAFNVATGAAFGAPLPVQPMKAIAAAAIASHMSLRETMAAGSVTAGAVLALAATGLLRAAARWVPVPVVKGIQFGAGLSLVTAAGPTLLRPLPWAAPRPLDNRLWALAAFAALVATHRRPRVPYALAVFLLGLALALVVLATDHLGFDRGTPHRLPGFGPWRPETGLPRWSADAVGLGLAQLPLTTLNSVLAASALAADLLPQLPAPSVTALGLSVAAMNLTGCWFGAMPVCHGAGGLAAQYRFGARSGASVILLGLFKMLLGLLFGETLLDLLTAFPHALLGVMVLASGLELAKVGQSLNHGAADLWEESATSAVAGAGHGNDSNKRHRDLSDDERTERWTVMLLTTAGILAFKNDAVGFLAGMFCHYAYRAADWLDARRRRAAFERTPLLNT